MQRRTLNNYLKGRGGLISLLITQSGPWILPPSPFSSRLGSIKQLCTYPTSMGTTRRRFTPFDGRAIRRCMLSTEGKHDCRAHDSTEKPVNSTVLKATMEVHVKSPEELEEIGAFVAADSGSGDTVLLWGDLGTGKTCFARGFVRARLGDVHLPVTSPSYLLDNTYKVVHEDITLHHMDLYRLRKGVDLHVLDIPKVLETSVCLIEWPDRLGQAQPTSRLDVHLVAIDEAKRSVTLTGYGPWWVGVVDDLRNERQRRNS